MLSWIISFSSLFSCLPIHYALSSIVVCIRSNRSGEQPNALQPFFPFSSWRLTQTIVNWHLICFRPCLSSLSSPSSLVLFPWGDTHTNTDRKYRHSWCQDDRGTAQNSFLHPQVGPVDSQCMVARVALSIWPSNWSKQRLKNNREERTQLQWKRNDNNERE